MDNIPHGRLVKLQAAEHLLRDLRPRRRMAMVVVDTLLIEPLNRRLPAVVKEHGPAQRPVRRCRHHRPDRMLADRQAMMVVILDRRHLRVELRQHNRRDPALIGQPHFLRVRGGDQLLQLCPDPLRGNERERGCHLCRGLLRRRIKPESKLGAEADGSQHPERILIESFPGASDAAHNLIPQIRQPAEQIHKPVPVIVGHRIDREVPAHEVFAQVPGVGNVVRVAVILIFPVQPVGCDLEALPLIAHRHRPVLDPGIDGAPEYLLHLPGERICCDIPVIRRPAENAVPHAAAHRISLKPCLMEG